MYRLITIALIIFSGIAAQAQSYTIKGQVFDPENQSLPNATVLLLKETDSTMVNYALSNQRGEFEIRNVARANYILRITYIGYASSFSEIKPPDQGNVLDLGRITLLNERVMLREVSISEERIPIRIKNDTIEYDVLAFKPLPNEVVEDLLKRMPGMEVQSDGNVVAQGETVRRVLVDGREFFGRDPKMATQNLPADAVARVQVFDQKSEQAQFTGIDDGQRERTINLELREDRKEGAFGNTSLAYGTEERFQGKTNLNRFDKKGQISILGMGNNINQQGFSIGEYLNFSGGPQSLMGGGGGRGMGGFSNPANVPISFDGLPSTNGLMNSWAGGVNFNRKIQQNTDLTASYFYNQLEHDVQQTLERENFLPMGNFFYNQQGLQDNRNYNHRLNLRFDHKFSETSSLLFTTNASANRTRTEQTSFSSTFNSLGELQNESDQLNNAKGQRMNIESSLLLRQRLNKPGRTITAGLDISASDNDQQGRLEANNRFLGQNPSEEIIVQLFETGSFNRTLAFNTTYTEPLGNRRFLEANYRITQNFFEVDQQVFDYENDIVFPNILLTNAYNNTNLLQRAGVNFRLNRQSYNLTLGSNLQLSNLRSNLLTLNQQINRDYTNFLPVVRFNYDFSNSRRIMADYTTNVQEPSILQLQPLIDNRDPLNLYEGNPNLRPSYRHRGTIRFNSFNPINSFGIFSFISADLVRNAITNSVSVDESLVRLVIPVNVESTLSARANVNLNMGTTKFKSRLSLGATVNHSQSVNVLNDIHQQIANNLLTGNVRYSFRPGDNFETSLTAIINQQLTKYEFGVLEQAFLNQTYGSETTWSFLDNYRLGFDFRYQVYEGRNSAFDRNVPMLNFNFSRRFLKNKAGELRLSGFNLLDKELGITQQVDVNYIQRQETNSLGRYFLMTFTYSLNRSLNVLDDIQRNPGRGMRMMMH
jgi:hypothetical protein